MTDKGRLPHAKNASYDTRQVPDNDEPQGCMAGTRKEILDELEEWAIEDAAPKVCWLNGMAGTGKTSIAHTLSERLDEKQMLGASFFCSRSVSQEVKDPSLIIPTIAAKLSQASPLLLSLTLLMNALTLGWWRNWSSLLLIGLQTYLSNSSFLVVRRPNS